MECALLSTNCNETIHIYIRQSPKNMYLSILLRDQSGMHWIKMKAEMLSERKRKLLWYFDTSGPRENSRHFTDVIFKSYPWTKIFHWNLFLIVWWQWQHGFRQWHGLEQATSHYLKQWWYVLLTQICVTHPQWLKLERQTHWCIPLRWGLIFAFTSHF